MIRIKEEDVKSGDKLKIEMAIQNNSYSEETDGDGNFVGVVKYVRWFDAVHCYEIVFEADEFGVERIMHLNDSVIYKLN